MKVLDAIRISISIPIIFVPCVFENKIFVDGGCLDNYPIHLFKQNMNKTIGIYVNDYKNYVANINNVEEYLKNIMDCFLEGISNYCSSFDSMHTIKIDCNNINGTINEQFNMMFENGYEITYKYLMPIIHNKNKYKNFRNKNIK